jgi:hypothetical protein
MAESGRETWSAGSAVINGRCGGLPLGIRSITATADGAVLLAYVHVGGVPRSTDGGATWRPTIDVDSDIHEVRSHPNRPGIVMVAAAIGPCTSGDVGDMGHRTEGRACTPERLVRSCRRSARLIRSIRPTMNCPSVV